MVSRQKIHLNIWLFSFTFNRNSCLYDSLALFHSPLSQDFMCALILPTILSLTKLTLLAVITTYYCSIGDYIISSVMHTFWLVLTDDLLEDRHIDDNSAWFKLDCSMILWTNHKSLLSIATNHFASCCMDNRLSQSAIFMSVKVAKFEIKRRFFLIF